MTRRLAQFVGLGKEGVLETVASSASTASPRRSSGDAEPID